MIFNWKKDPDFLKKVQEAESILNSKIFLECFDALRQKYIAEWEHSSNQIERDAAYNALSQLNRVKGHLESYAKTLKFAEIQGKK